MKLLQEANTPVQSVLVLDAKGQPIQGKYKQIGGMPTGLPRNIRDLFYESTGKEVNGNMQYRLKRMVNGKDLLFLTLVRI